MNQCYLCETSLDSAVVVNTIARHDEPQTSVSCSRCGLVQVVPMPSANVVDAYYASGEYRRKFPWNPVSDDNGQIHDHGTPEWEALMSRSWGEYADRILRSIGRPVNSAIEWGCGNGMLLEVLKSSGIRVHGIEPDPLLHEVIRARGVDVSLAATGGADLAIAVHVLEHWREPLRMLEQMRAALVPGGRVWIEVPNLAKPYGGLRHFFQWPHLYNFTVDTLACLLVRAGFDDIFVAEQEHIILAHGTHEPEQAPCSFDGALERMRVMLPVGAVGAEIAAALAEYTRQRETSPGARLGEWLGQRGGDDDWLRDEFELMADALTVTLHSLGKMGEDLDKLITEDSWHPNEWVLAYRCGAKEMAQRAQVAVTHIANNLAARATR